MNIEKTKEESFSRLSTSSEVSGKEAFYPHGKPCPGPSGSIRGKSWTFFLFSVVCLQLVSCAQVAKDMGLENPSDLELRSGPTGTPAEPVALDPFKKYTLVLAAGECRYFQMKVPSSWYWKVFLTVDNRDFKREGRLSVDFARPNPPWGKLPNVDMAKIFLLRREGVQGVIGVGNKDQPRYALLRICQEGAPLKVTLDSEVSSIGGLLGPKKKPKDN